MSNDRKLMCFFYWFLVIFDSRLKNHHQHVRKMIVFRLRESEKIAKILLKTVKLHENHVNNLLLFGFCFRKPFFIDVLRTYLDLKCPFMYKYNQRFKYSDMISELILREVTQGALSSCYIHACIAETIVKELGDVEFAKRV